MFANKKVMSIYISRALHVFFSTKMNLRSFDVVHKTVFGSQPIASATVVFYRDNERSKGKNFLPHSPTSDGENYYGKINTPFPDIINLQL